MLGITNFTAYLTIPFISIKYSSAKFKIAQINDKKKLFSNN